MAKKKTRNFQPTALQIDVLDAIREGNARGEIVKLDDITVALLVKRPALSEKEISAALHGCARGGRAQWIPKRAPSGNVRKIWGWVTTKARA